MRAFVGVDLPTELKEKIFAFSNKLVRDKKVRLVKRGNFHLTLAFLGDLPDGKLLEAKEILARIKDFGKIRLAIGEIKVFLRENEAGEVVLLLGGDLGRLFALQRRIVEELEKRGIFWVGRKREFVPHITLFRFDDQPPTIFSDLRIEGGFLAERFALFTSELLRGGSVYSKIAEFELK